MYAHIYNASPAQKKVGNKYQLLLTPTMQPVGGQSLHFASKPEAKAAAKAAGAKAWNF